MTIPASLAEIGDYAFDECTGLTAVYYNCEEPREIDEGMYVFGDEVYENASLYVPAVAVDKCKAMEPWMNFKNIMSYNFGSGVATPCEETIDMKTPEVYSLDGAKISETIDNIASGIYILRRGDNVKKIRVK